MNKKRMMAVFIFLGMSTVFSSCASVAGPDKLLLNLPDHAGPTAALAAHLDVYVAAHHEGRDTSLIRREIEKLADQYPYSVEILEANAGIACENGELQKARRFLDRVYQLDPNRPESAILRSELALSDGNLPLARRILEKQIQLAPDHPGLRESLAGVLYFEKKYDQAKTLLQAAFRMGAPRERINYHLGLLAEARNKPDEAMKHYEEALKGDVAFDPARPRLAALKASQV